MPGPNFPLFYPRSAALGLLPVSNGSAEHPGADEDDVKAKLGAVRFANLMTKVKNVFSCGHRKYPKGYTRSGVTDSKGSLVDLGGYEAHAIYFDDIEAFLQAGG